MNKTSLPAAAYALCIWLLLPASAIAQGTTRVVDDDGRASSVSCEAANPAPSSIQAAINLSVSGDTILVCPGVYPEQLKIVEKSLTIRGVTSGDLKLVLIKPRAVVANSTNAYSGTPVAAIVAVERSASVTLQNLTIDGVDNMLTGCAPNLVGIFYRNSSGAVLTTAVRNVRLPSGLGTCASGFGIFAQSGGGGVSKVSVSDSSVHGYQKVGIVGNEVGTALEAIDNTVAGDGTIPTIAQNGIQVGFGAVGSIRRNAVVNHVYTCPDFPCDTSSNILVFEASGIRVTGNRTAKSVIGINLVRSDDSVVRGNRVSDTDVFDGISILGSRNRVRLNTIVNSDEFGLYVDGDDNAVEGNRINEAPCGIFTNGASNTLVDNVIANTELATCKPFTLSFQALMFNSPAGASFMPATALRNPTALLQRDAAGVVLRSATPAR